MTVVADERMLLSTGQVARALGVSSMTITRWRAAGKIRAATTTAAGHPRWYLEDVRRQVAESRADDKAGDGQ